MGEMTLVLEGDREKEVARLHFGIDEIKKIRSLPTKSAAKAKKAKEYGTKIITLDQVEAALKGKTQLP